MAGRSTATTVRTIFSMSLPKSGTGKGASPNTNPAAQQLPYFSFLALDSGTKRQANVDAQPLHERVDLCP